MKIKYCIYSLLVGSAFCINGMNNQNWNLNAYGLSKQQYKYTEFDEKKDSEENGTETYSPEFKLILPDSLNSSDIVLRQLKENKKKSNQNGQNSKKFNNIPSSRVSSKSGLPNSEIKDSTCDDGFDIFKEVKIDKGAFGAVLDWLSMVSSNNRASQDNLEDNLLVKQELEEIENNNNQRLVPSHAPSTRVNHESVQSQKVQEELENIFSLNDNNRKETIEDRLYNLQRPLNINRNSFNSEKSKLLLESPENQESQNQESSKANQDHARRARRVRVNRADYPEKAENNSPLKALRVKKPNNNAKLALLGVTAIAGLYKFRHKIKDVYVNFYNKFFNKKSDSKLDLVKKFEKTLTKEQWEEYSIFYALNKAYEGDYSVFNISNNSSRNSSDLLNILTNDQQELVKKIAS